jgi:hypothetical protein
MILRIRDPPSRTVVGHQAANRSCVGPARGMGPTRPAMSTMAIEAGLLERNRRPSFNV